MRHKTRVLTVLLTAVFLITDISSLTAFAEESEEQAEDPAQTDEEAIEVPEEETDTSVDTEIQTLSDPEPEISEDTGSETEEDTAPASEPEVCRHSYSVTKTVAATFTKEGSKTWTCSKCGDSYTEKIAKTIPKLSNTKANKDSITVSWKALDGAKGYAVLRKTGANGSWKRIATTSATSYEDRSSFSNGKKYFYTVRAYKGSKSTALANTYSSSYWSGYDKDGISFTYTKAPKISKITNAASGIKVTWGKVSGAKGYAVYRKTTKGSYKRLGTTTKTSYTDKSAKVGTTYYYTVRAYTGSKSDALGNTYKAKYWSGYNSGKKARYLKTPSSLQVTTNTASKRILKWSGVKNASGYAIYRRKGKDGSWKMVGTTTKKTYTDKGSLTKGQKYYYTVRAYRGKVKTAKNNKYSSYYWGSYLADGVGFTAKGTSTSTSAEALDKGAVYESGRTSGGKLTRRKGVVWYHGHKETYYSQKVLRGGGLRIPGRHVNSSDQTVRDKNNFICVASGKYKKGTIVETSLGVGKVYDSGCARNTIDIYTNW